jgi:diadenosine tetraphosphate (Ap4A) HIT family hydrolase
MIENNCPFCTIKPERIIADGNLVFAIRDQYPVNSGHTLVISKRHFSSWFDATYDERLEILQMVDRLKALLDDELHPDGYNIGVNVGGASGQTVAHLHFHLIPRFYGDVDDPRGGVRYVIPGKGNYKSPGKIPKIGNR